MSHQKTSYMNRLPYGYGFDPVARIEVIFDRTYHAIATRSVDTPHAPTVHAKRPGYHAGSLRGGWFYKDGDLPRCPGAAQNRGERVLSRFLLGIDVRPFIQRENQGNLPEVTDPKFIPIEGDDDGRLGDLSGPFPPHEPSVADLLA